MRAVIYTRISKDAAQEGRGVERQRELCEERCAQRGWTVVEVYEDNDVSAAGTIKKQRPRYNAMLEAAKAGEFDVLVAYSNSRLSRRPAEWIDLINLASNGPKIEIETIAGSKYDLTTAEGRALALTVAAWDAAEAERTAERVKAQKVQQAKDGRAQGGRFRVYGYTREWEVIKDEAEVVKEVFNRKASGESTTAIARDLNSRGITTVTGNGWDSGNLTKLLKKPGYAGLREYEGQIVGKTAYAALVEESVYTAAQSKAVKRKPGHNARKHLLSGILVCSKCLSTMKGKEASGKRTYVCTPNPATAACGKTSISMDWTDEAVMSEVWKQQQTHEPVESGVKTSTEDLQAVIDDIRDKRIPELKAAYSSGAMPLADMLELKAIEEEKLAELAKQQTETVVTHWGIMQPFNDFEEMNLAQKRLFISRFVSNVVVMPPNARGRHVTKYTTMERLEIHPVTGKPHKLKRPKRIIRFETQEDGTVTESELPVK